MIFLEHLKQQKERKHDTTEKLVKKKSCTMDKDTDKNVI